MVVTHVPVPVLFPKLQLGITDAGFLAVGTVIKCVVIVWRRLFTMVCGYCRPSPEQRFWRLTATLLFFDWSACPCCWPMVKIVCVQVCYWCFVLFIYLFTFWAAIICDSTRANEALWGRYQNWHFKFNILFIILGTFWHQVMFISYSYPMF